MRPARDATPARGAVQYGAAADPAPPHHGVAPAPGGGRRPSTEVTHPVENAPVPAHGRPPTPARAGLRERAAARAGSRGPAGPGEGRARA